MGYGKLWIQNEFYGTNQDFIYFQGYLISIIDELINAKTIEFEFKKLTKSELFKYFENYSNRFEYLISGSTFTDDFIGYRFEKSGIIYMIWKLRNDQEILHSDLKNYGADVKFCLAKKMEVINIKSELIQKAHIKE